MTELTALTKCRGWAYDSNPSSMHAAAAQDFGDPICESPPTMVPHSLRVLQRVSRLRRRTADTIRIVVQLWDLWAQWWSGGPSSDVRLWGWPLKSWGRLGKVLQFVAGLTVVLDLIGPEPLRDFGRRLPDEPWRRFAGLAESWAIAFAAASLLGFYGLILLSIVAPGFLFNPGAVASWLSSTPAAIIALLTLFAVGFLLTPMARRVVGSKSKEQGREGLYYRLRNARVANSRALFVELPLALPFLLAAAIPLLAWAIVTYGIFLPVTRGLAVLLDRSRPAHPVRWLAFVLFLVGFHFDLLAS